MAVKLLTSNVLVSLPLCPGSVVISAITSCTNTSNPSVMLGAGLLAKNAVEKGLRVAPYVKTSLSPGSGVVTYYLNESGVIPYLEELGYVARRFLKRSTVHRFGMEYGWIEHQAALCMFVHGTYFSLSLVPLTMHKVHETLSGVHLGGNRWEFDHCLHKCGTIELFNLPTLALKA